MARTTSGSTDTSSYPTPAPSVARMFYDRVAATPHAEAFRYPTAGGWASVTWAQTAETVRTMAAGLLALGILPEQRVAIASATRVEWLYADLAIMCAGAATTAVYPSTAEEDVAYILADSGTRIVFAEDDTQVAKLRAQRDHLPDLIRVVTFDGQADGEWVLSLADLEALGAKHLVENPTSVDEAVAAVEPEQLATLIYTSGTTGRPKGVELPHRCWTYIGAGAEAIGILSPGRPAVPVAAAVALVRQDARGGAAADRFRHGGRRPDGPDRRQPRGRSGRPSWPVRRGSSRRCTRRSCRPSRKRAGSSCRLFTWAFGVGGQVSRARIEGRRPNPLVQAQFALADRLVLSKVRARLGGRIRFLVSGSAALSQDIAAWFHAAGLVVIEGYALTETGGGACIGSPEHPMFGVVGPPLVGSEIKLADDGEILIRGPLVMRGYHNLPDATSEVLAADGWFATGDIGEIDDAGRLRVTDRKKDLIKTSGGKYISPQAIEVMFKAVCPLASQMLVHADRRNYATALITLDPDALAQWARAQGLTATDYAVAGRGPGRARLRAVQRRRAQRPAEPLGDDQGLPDPRPRPVGRERRADAEPEGQAQGDRGEVRVAARLDVRRSVAWLTR